ncbi:Fe-S cluster assembly protein SufD [Oceanithermus desulfurans]
MNETVTTLSLENLHRRAERRGEPDWLRGARERAWRIFERLDWPTRKNEAWRYTDLDPAWFGLELEEVRPAELRERDALPRAVRERLAESDAEAALVFEDGRLVYAHLPAELSAKGVVLSDLAGALERHGEHVEGALYQAVTETSLQGPEDKLAALNAALWGYGAFVYVPAGVTLEAPIGVFHYASRPGKLSLSRTLIVLDDNAEATFIEEYLSEAHARTHVATGELLLRPGARLRHAGVQTWGAGVRHFHRQRALLEKDAVLLDLAVNLGGTLARTEVASELVGPGADSEMLGVYFAGKDQHLDHYTTQHHVSAQARSDVYYKGAATANGRVVYQGLIQLEPTAQKTDAYQTNRNLLLSREARAESVPQLEIAANDVRCSHGSSTAPVDEEQLFYLATRGLPRVQAQQLLVAAFLEEVLGRVPLEKLRHHIAGIIEGRLRDA